MFLISEGSEFHNIGAAIVNDLSPVVAADFFSGAVNNISHESVNVKRKQIKQKGKRVRWEINCSS